MKNPNKEKHPRRYFFLLALLGLQLLFLGSFPPQAQRESYARAYSNEEGVILSFRLEGIYVQGEGVKVGDQVAFIDTPGTYILVGQISNGQVIVDAKGPVELILAGVEIQHHRVPLYIQSTYPVTLTLKDDTDNRLVSKEEEAESERPHAVIYSEADLVIKGEGTLVVEGVWHGIATRKAFTLLSGNLRIYALRDGIKGRESVTIEGGMLSIEAGSDGIESTRGSVLIREGTLALVTGGDGIAAETSVVIYDGTIHIISGGGSPETIASTNPFGRRETREPVAKEEKSTKGIKARTDITIYSGQFRIDAFDDAIHSDHSITIHDGVFHLATGDDAIHADHAFTANGGYIEIVKSYEGIEAANITINDGFFSIVSQDDGINAAKKREAGTENGMARPIVNQGASLVINGGTMVIDAKGDGIDVNGDILMTGGRVLVSGPSTGPDSAIDYDGTFILEGGFLLGLGSTQMAQTPHHSSPQKSLVFVPNTLVPVGTLLHIAGENQEEILTLKVTKPFSFLVVSTPTISEGSAYLFTGGSHSGSETNGVFSGGTYTPGTLQSTLSTENLLPNQRGGMPGKNTQVPLRPRR